MNLYVKLAAPPELRGRDNMPACVMRGSGEACDRVTAWWDVDVDVVVDFDIDGC